MIAVQLVDVDGAVTFPPMTLPPDQLPESFEADTTLHLGDAPWSVVEARPMTAAEFRRTGQLTLLVRKVQMVDPATILYSLPTICEQIGAILPRSSKAGLNTLELHEDDWRQVEWVSARLKGAIEHDIEAVREIYASHREGHAFAQIHLRRAVPSPLLGCDLPLDAWIARGTRLGGVSYTGVAGVVAGSFAIRLASSIEMYGLLEGGRVSVLAFQNTRASSGDVAALAAFAARYDLLLVDWCNASVLSAREEDYRELFA